MYLSQIYRSPSPKVSNFEFNEILPKAMIFYCQQWFSNVRFPVPPEFGSPAWDDSLVDVSLIGPTFPTSNFGSQNLLLPRVTLNFGIALVVWWKIDYFWWVFPVTSSTFFSTPNSFGRGHPLAMLRSQDLGVQGSQTTTFSFFPPGRKEKIWGWWAGSQMKWNESW